MLKKGFFIILFLFVAKLFAQHPLYVHLTEKDGLPDIEFYGVLEDKDGFIWLAADKGLYRYDGKTFKNYSHPQKRGLSVFGLKFDNNGRLWCNNISGQYFYVEDDKLKLFADLKHNTGGQLASFFFREKSLVVSCYPKMFQVDFLTKEETDLSKSNELVGYGFKEQDTIFKIIGDTLKSSTNKTLFKVKQNLTNDNGKYSWNHKYIHNKLLLFGYDYYVEEQKILFSKDGKLRDLKLHSYDKKIKIVDVFVDDDLVWFITNSGIYIYKYLGSDFKFETIFFKGEEITSVIKDKKDNYWISTLRSGIYIIPNKHIQNHKLPKGFGNITALERVDRDQIIIGSTKGKLAIVNTDTNKVVTLDSLSHKKVFTIANNGKKEVYVCFANKSFILDKTNHYKIKPTKVGEFHKFSNAKDISVIDSTRFVMSSYSSAYIWNRFDLSHTNLNVKRSYTSHYSPSKKEIYVGYVDGVEMYNEDLISTEIKLNGQSIFAIDIEETEDGVIWISTFKDGIIGVKNGKVVANYTIKNGLLSNQTNTIKADGIYLWVVTDKAIQKFNTRSKTFENLTKKDGITSFNISDIVVLDDKVYFGSNKGLFQIDKKGAFKKHILLDFYFTNVLVEDESVEIKSKYNLPSDVNKIQFQFHTNGFFSEDDVHYQYRLKGASDNWTYVTDNSQQITFNSLSAGKYDFQLKGLVTSNELETPVKTIHIKINQPFYKDWWFIVLCILTGGVIIVTYYKNKLRLKENEKQLQLEKAAKDKELVFLKLENLSSQMNPHFIFNALNSIQDYILLNQRNLASDYLGKFADLIRMYLHHSTKGNISLSEEIEALSQYLELEKLRFEDSLDYQINLSNEIDSEIIEIPTMLIQPYVENALKHGLLHKKDNRNLSISFSLEEKQQNLLCNITDNGVGRKKASELKAKRIQSHQSFASKATNDRLDLLNYGKEYKTSIKIIDLYTKEGEAAGTQVLISIPYTKL
ncbi:sensor histidine kinase [Pseudofulvibacter geojedonensis]|uniref:Histidine kinase n=1 Tax=Pseudofulvibacter geojedonensis TaxID=1123758 RepID=A0ABW3I421_9FLAO